MTDVDSPAPDWGTAEREVLRAVSALMAGTTDLTEVIDGCADLVGEYLGADRVWVAHHDADAGLVGAATSRGGDIGLTWHPEGYDGLVEALRSGRSAWGQVPMIATDAPRTRPVSRELALVVPAVMNGQVRGALVVHGADPDRTHDPVRRRLVETVGTAVATALVRRAELTAIHAAREDLERLHRSTAAIAAVTGEPGLVPQVVVDQACYLVAGDAAVLLLAADDRDRPVPAARATLDGSDPLALVPSEVWTRAAARRQAERLTCPAALVVPLTFAVGPSLGTLVVTSTEPRQFTDAQLTLLEQLAGHAGAALVYAQLLESLRAAAERERTEASRLRVLSRIAEQVADGVAVADLSNRYTYVNQAFAALHGYRPEELVGVPTRVLFQPRTAEIQQASIRDLVRREGKARTQVERRRRDGTYFTAMITVSELIDEAGRPDGMVATLSDVSERHAMEERLRHQALHDDLTGLPNRSALVDRLFRALAAKDRHGPIGVLFIDLDKLKTINDALGHSAGDQALVTAAGRISSCLRPGDTLARLGGDEFVVLLDRLPDATMAQAIADRIVRAVGLAVRLHGLDVAIGASVGIAIGHPGADDADTLLLQADVAMYAAKAAGGSRSEVYDPAMSQAAVAELETVADLRHALTDPRAGGLAVHFQPVVRLTDRRIVSAEALVRWVHPRRGPLSPAEFLPTAERAGLVGQLDRWVLHTALDALAQWEAHPGTEPGTMVGVNLSAWEVVDPGMVDRITGCLEEHRINPHRLLVEVTETALLVSGVDQAARHLGELRDRGVGIALDAFGTGYSSLAHLRDLPVDVVKVDRSFVEGIDARGREQDLATAVVRLGQALGVDVIAEGVETESAREALVSLGCPYAQGFLFSRAVPLAELLALGGWA
ncbi:MAG: bifunctional diguanylate cyclase/phosphodiesterase [Actinomycetes bacterium]